MEHADGVVEVRTIGGLEVRRPDGRMVDRGEWGTAKTRDLLRLLVLEQGRAVATDQILQALWPSVDRAHGAASIRTAASRIRAVTGTACVRREAGGLRLDGVRSDVEDLQNLVRHVRRLHLRGDHVRTLRVVARHERLLTGDLDLEVLESPSGRDVTWVLRARQRVAALQREVEALHVKSMATVSHLHDCRDLAQWALGNDPFAERPHRVLMRALAALGEPAEALAVYQRLRSFLEVERGAQPSPRTRRLHEEIRSTITDSEGP
jgi:DNA-binding SARP family transcriptional activator